MEHLDSVPEPFTQCLVTRTGIDDNFFTTSWSLLPNKRAETYVASMLKMFQESQ